jgi:hypothetical protein
MFTAALLAMSLVVVSGAPAAVPPEKGFVPPAATQADFIADMTAAAKALAEVLPADELRQATFTYGGKEHKFWHYVPTPLLANPDAVGSTYTPYGRFGVPIEKMSQQAIDRLHALLRVSLSFDGYQRYVQIMRTEGVSNPEFSMAGLNRSAESKPAGGITWYHVSLFGQIGAGDWGWRLEGHHFSLSIEVSNGRVKFSPVMVGYNPWPQMPTANLCAVALLQSLSKEQQDQAQLAKGDQDIPNDIKREPGKPTPVGVQLGQLSLAGRLAYERLIDEFIGQFPEALVAELRQTLATEAPQAWLAWYGSTDHAKPYFITLQSPSYLIQMRHNGIERSGFVHGHVCYHELTTSTGSQSVP